MGIFLIRVSKGNKKRPYSGCTVCRKQYRCTSAVSIGPACAVISIQHILRIILIRSCEGCRCTCFARCQFHIGCRIITFGDRCLCGKLAALDRSFCFSVFYFRPGYFFEQAVISCTACIVYFYYRRKCHTHTGRYRYIHCINRFFGSGHFCCLRCISGSVCCYFQCDLCCL